MEPKLKLEFAAKTDKGLVRAQNEDALALSPRCGFAVLADGMGGYNAGEVASSIACTVVRDTLEECLIQLEQAGFNGLPNRGKYLQQLVAESIHCANAAIIDAAQKEPQCRGMGTTLVVALFQAECLVIGHVGDSRVYRWRDGRLEQITRDHSLLQEQIDAGLMEPDLARFSSNKNLVTRAVGVDEGLEVETHEHVVQPGDIYLLCSDGLSDMLASEDITAILAASQGMLDHACEALVHHANSRGGHDNISVILIRYCGSDAVAEVQQRSLLQRFRRWLT